jgi:CHAT domain-containing protein
LLDLRDPIEASNADGQALYKMLIAPAAGVLRPETQVIILADGILSQLNFETLLAPGPSSDVQSSSGSAAPLHYLLEDFTFSSAPSLAMLAAPAPPAGASSRMLLFGNPVSPSREFLSLPMFGFEMNRIESHFAPARLSVFAGPQATPTAYIASQPRQFSYIHFVSHAVASQTNPLDSAIILSNPAGQENDFKLYAREIIRHPINARLVTISACYGSGTRAYAGEGLVGLSWAFLRAGALRVIGALWEVSDDSTPQLMDRLYQNLSSGESPAIALRDAKLALLRSGDRFRIPYYWAPFQLYRRQ